MTQQNDLPLEPKTPDVQKPIEKPPEPPPEPTTPPEEPKPEEPKPEPAKPAAQAPPPPPPPAAAGGAIIPVVDDIDPDHPSRALSAFTSEHAFKAGYRIARALCSSSLVPREYQGEQNIPNVLIAMELANRIGASVLMVMQSLDIIQGRPGWRAQFLIATVNASGRFTPLRFRWSGKEGTPEWGCRCFAKDRSDGEECTGALITMALAKEEGWIAKKGSKWVTMPEQMLLYRSAAFWTRVYAPELSLGMRTAEELADIDCTDDDRPTALPRGIVPGSPTRLEEALRAAGAR